MTTVILIVINAAQSEVANFHVWFSGNQDVSCGKVSVHKFFTFLQKKKRSLFSEYSSIQSVKFSIFFYKIRLRNMLWRHNRVCMAWYKHGNGPITACVRQPYVIKYNKTVWQFEKCFKRVLTRYCIPMVIWIANCNSTWFPRILCVKHKKTNDKKDLWTKYIQSILIVCHRTLHLTLTYTTTFAYFKQHKDVWSKDTHEYSSLGNYDLVTHSLTNCFVSSSSKILTEFFGSLR